MTDATASAKTGKSTDSSLYPIAVLIDELRDEDQKKRINAINQFATICVALGPERTRTELLPYILELLEEDEEVLTALAEVLGTVLDHVGGPAHCEHLLRVLERLCQIEELAVREKATESVKKILAQIRVKDFESSLMGMMQRLMDGDSNTSRYTAVHLIPVMFVHLQAQNQQELLEFFNKIVADQAPQIRKQASILLIQMIRLMPKVSEAELMQLFSKVHKDEQDSVRMHSIECCVEFSKHMAPAKQQSQLLPYVKKLSEDKSWRIRYMVADKIIDLASGIGFDAAKEHLLPHYVSFLKDTEAEVRTAALHRLAEFSKVLDANIVSGKIVPCLTELQKDQQTYVRSALAESMLSICPIIGKQASTQNILPVFLLLLRDEQSEVRLNLFTRLDDLNSVIGIEELQTSLIPSLEELSKEKNWRLKIQVIEQFPMLARQLGESFFNEKLNAICLTWLKDSVYSVREAALQNFKSLTGVFGEQWAVKHVLPPLFALQTEISYLHRLTVLFGIVALSEHMSTDVLKSKMMPMLVTMHKDPVANVRLNVAKSLQQLQKPLKSNKDSQDSALKMLRALEKDKDQDVEFFATKALRQLN